METWAEWYEHAKSHYESLLPPLTFSHFISANHPPLGQPPLIQNSTHVSPARRSYTTTIFYDTVNRSASVQRTRMIGWRRTSGRSYTMMASPASTYVKFHLNRRQLLHRACGRRLRIPYLVGMGTSSNRDYMQARHSDVQSQIVGHHARA